ncbi:MAG TPA: protein translocase subunit SecF, partial [Steroidobacteraceae bacterium]|nr:protein translocase subunit SecF [Steroidobacteraceae bacterium]
MEFFSHQTSYPFMATRKVWYTLSALLIVVSLTSFFTRGLNLAIDFTGGVNAEVSFPGAANVESVRSQLSASGFHDAQVQVFGSSRDIGIRLPPDAKQSATEIRARLEGALHNVDAKAQVVQLEVVGPQVGSELQKSAIWALLFTLLFIFGYLAFRFHTWRLSLGAIFAVLHDPILVLGFFSIT